MYVSPRVSIPPVLIINQRIEKPESIADIAAPTFIQRRCNIVYERLQAIASTPNLTIKFFFVKVWPIIPFFPSSVISHFQPTLASSSSSATRPKTNCDPLTPPLPNRILLSTYGVSKMTDDVGPSVRTLRSNTGFLLPLLFDVLRCKLAPIRGRSK